MGVEPFLVGLPSTPSSPNVWLAGCVRQCKEAYTPTAEALQEAHFPMEGLDSLPTLFRAIGCGHCSNTGYRGRLAIHELMTINEEIELLAVERAATEQLTKAAIANGMRTLCDRTAWPRSPWSHLDRRDHAGDHLAAGRRGACPP